MFKICKNPWFGATLSALLFILMLPCSVGYGVLPIQPWSCFFSWIFLVPLLISIRHGNQRQYILFGFLFCFLSCLGTLYWVFIAFQKYGNISTFLSFLILIAMVLTISSFRFMAFFATSFFLNHKHFTLLATILFSLTEWLMFYVPFGGFPWVTPGHAVLPMHHMIQSIDLFGIQGMNIVVFYVNFLVLECILNRQNQKRINWKPIATMILFLVGMWIYGDFQIKKYQNVPDEKSLTIALIQGNISQDIKWSYQDRQDIIQIYKDLTTLASQSNPDLIVWPEASLPRTLPVQDKKITDIPENLTSSLVIGAPTWFKENGKTKYKNSAFTVTKDGTVTNRYDKVKLVPFGEYIPSFGFFSIEKWMPAVAGNFTAGTLDQTIPAVKGHPFGLFTCFEVLFPKLARAWVNQGAEFFVSITNDGWFDDGSGPHQHVQFSAIRAVEFRKPIVRAANTGITTWYDATGMQFDTLDLFQRGYTFARIHPNSDMTIYSRFPFAVPALLWLLFGCIMIYRKFV